MDSSLLHPLPSGIDPSAAPEQMLSPYTLPPHPWAQAAARALINKVHTYMRAHGTSELHRQGKMFGVLVVRTQTEDFRYLCAFSAQLDGSYTHEGFVPPVYEMPEMPVGKDRDESKRLQQLLFANYRFTNGAGESRNALELFAHEKPIIPADEWFGRESKIQNRTSLPPAGAGECCAPKLLQFALLNHLTPLALAEFWIGSPPQNELRREGLFYAPCSGKCMPILKHMLRGIQTLPPPEEQQNALLCRAISVLYEDDYLMVVNKPAGLLSVPGKTEEISLSEYLKSEKHYTYLLPAHRLDQDTSGLIVLAKTPEIYSSLQSYFQRRDILKRYEAVVMSVTPVPNDPYSPLEESGQIALPLLPNPYDRPRQMVDHAHGKTAITDYRIREHRKDGSVFVDFYPRTGRTHQLRVHAAHPDGLNAPIVGDRLYGTADKRLFLHAAEIQFVHPVTKEEMHFCIPSGF